MRPALIAFLTALIVAQSGGASPRREIDNVVAFARLVGVVLLRGRTCTNHVSR